MYPKSLLTKGNALIQIEARISSKHLYTYITAKTRFCNDKKQLCIQKHEIQFRALYPYRMINYDRLKMCTTSTLLQIWRNIKLKSAAWRFPLLDLSLHQLCRLHICKAQPEKAFNCHNLICWNRIIPMAKMSCNCMRKHPRMLWQKAPVFSKHSALTIS